jgi:hypothetical protein
MAAPVPKPPAGLGKTGRALWRAVMRDFALDEHETTILREACRTADSLDALQVLLEAEGLMSETSQGPRIHPALVELRQQRVTFARLLTALRIPIGEADAGRTQARGGTRGVYGLRGVS